MCPSHDLAAVIYLRVAMYTRALKTLANVLAKTLGPSMETIEMYYPSTFPSAASFQVVRYAEAGDDGIAHSTSRAELVGREMWMSVSVCGSGADLGYCLREPHQWDFPRIQISNVDSSGSKRFGFLCMYDLHAVL